MGTVQIDLSEAAMANAIRANLCDFFRFLTHKLPTDDRFENDRFTRWYTPLAHPWFNGMLCSASPTREDSDFIRETIQYFKGRKVGAFTCWLEPHLERADWEPLLFEHGFGFSDDTPGMAADLDSLPETPAMPDGLEIRAVEDESALRSWAQVFTIGYGLPPDWESAIFEVWSAIGLDFPVRNYLETLDGEPVTTSTVYYSSGVAGIYDVATLPEARGHGLGTALTLAPLLDAHQAGYRIGVLQSSEMGFGVYKKMGFRHLCQIENFYRLLH